MRLAGYGSLVTIADVVVEDDTEPNEVETALVDPALEVDGWPPILAVLRHSAIVGMRLPDWLARLPQERLLRPIIDADELHRTLADATDDIRARSGEPLS